MAYFKKNIFGVLALLIGIYLLFNTVSNILELKRFEEFNTIGEYIAVEKSIEPSLTSGILSISLIFLLSLLVPVVLSIVHKRRKADLKIMYVALSIVLANFLVFPYLLMLIYNVTTIN